MGKDTGLIYSPTVVIQQLITDQDPIVVGAVKEKGTVCPSKPKISLSDKT